MNSTAPHCATFGALSSRENPQQEVLPGKDIPIRAQLSLHCYSSSPLYFVALPKWLDQFERHIPPYTPCVTVQEKTFLLTDYIILFCCFVKKIIHVHVSQCDAHLHTDGRLGLIFLLVDGYTNRKPQEQMWECKICQAVKNMYEKDELTLDHYILFASIFF